MKALLLACSDGRLTQVLEAFLVRRHAEAAERLLVPGGPLLLTRPGMQRRVALDCLHTLVEARAPRRILLVSHQDCAAYERALGGLGFDQREILERDLRRVRTLLENEFPEIEVSCWFVPLIEDGVGASFGEPRRVD
ncbi:MAG: hypothetical protein GX537_06485 [Actinobacteria bacterium]|nr:hypothetical protein [Actinomycetota bacterium]